MLGPPRFYASEFLTSRASCLLWRMSPPLNLIGPQLRKLRYKRELSQPKLAEECQRGGWDVGRDTIANIEAQRRWVTDFELLFIARILAVPLEELLPAPSQAPRAIKAAMEGKKTKRETAKR